MRGSLPLGHLRIALFQVWEGGGEYNVARDLKRCFGLDTAIVTALADNPVGRLIQDLCQLPLPSANDKLKFIGQLER